MKLLVICAASLSAVLAAPAFSQDGQFDHFTEVFDDNIAMPTEPREVPSSDPAPIPFTPEHRELVEPHPRPQPIRAPHPYGNYFTPGQQLSPFRYLQKPLGNIYGFYQSDPYAFYNPYQNQPIYFKDSQYQPFPQGLAPTPYLPYQQAYHQAYQQQYRPVYVVPVRQHSNSGQSTRPVTILYVAGVNPAAGSLKDPVKETEDSLITESQIFAGNAAAPVKADYAEKEFGSEKKAEDDDAKKKELDDDIKQEPFHEENLMAAEAKPALDVEVEGSGAALDDAADEKSAPISLTSYLAKGNTGVKSEEAHVVESLTSKEFEEYDDLTIRGAPAPLEIFENNSKDNKVLQQMLGIAAPSS